LRGGVAIADGRSNMLGMKIGTPESEPIRTKFLRKLTRRGQRGVELVSSDAHPITCLADPVLLEQNDEWRLQRDRDMTLETLAPLSDNSAVRLPAMAA
jgi:Transposase, Mutator family